MQTNPLLVAKQLTKTFPSPSGGEKTIAVDQVDLTLYPGEVVALIGESGSGKTTLGRALLRLLPIDEGEVLFNGTNLFRLNAKSLRLARRSFQMIFQNQQANLHPRLSVFEMLDESLALHQSNLTKEERDQRARELLGRVGLSDHGERYLASLSGGEQRRVGLARILATSPKLVVADEPTSGLDAAIKLQIVELLKELREGSLTYLLISHDLGLVRRIADRVIVMLRGRVIEEIQIGELGSTAHHPYTEKLLHAARLGEVQRQSSQPDHYGKEQSYSVEDVPTSGNGCHYCDLCPLVQRDQQLKVKCEAKRPPLSHGVACFVLSDQRGEH